MDPTVRYPMPAPWPYDETEPLTREDRQVFAAAAVSIGLFCAGMLAVFAVVIWFLR